MNNGVNNLNNNTNNLNNNTNNMNNNTNNMNGNHLNQMNSSNIVNNNINSSNSLKPMEGVRFAPISSEPINASNSSTSTSTYRPNGFSYNQNTVLPNNTANKNGPTLNKTENTSNLPEKKDSPVVIKKKKSFLSGIFFFIIIVMGGYIYYSAYIHKIQIEQLKYNCTPINSSYEDKEIDINSTIVQDLYSKVFTTIREDYVSNEFNDEMKLYLAFRQIPIQDFYSSNCNLFRSIDMEPYICDVNSEFVPKAFKVSSLEREIKKMYGEITSLPLRNIQLKNSCIGGYRYIPERGEYVEGLCKQNFSIPFKVEKNLVSAVTNQNSIILKEEVVYKQSKDLQLPEYLKNGYNIYTFRLDMNYNYVLVSKKYESKY
ncbi:MAG: hypothetical protein IKE70_01300 [Bacilli bacterium]|nr:hypothetical protein [Bacilli bacterium]